MSTPMTADEAICVIKARGANAWPLHHRKERTGEYEAAEAAIRLAFAVLEIVESLPPGDSAPCPAWIIHEARARLEATIRRDQAAPGSR